MKSYFESFGIDFYMNTNSYMKLYINSTTVYRKQRFLVSFYSTVSVLS